MHLWPYSLILGIVSSPIYSTMRTLYLTVVLMMLFGIAAAQKTQIEALGSSQVCAGYTAASQIKVGVVPTRSHFDVGGKSIKAYQWVMDHANGSKYWHTNQSTRWIPIYWPGQYRVYCITYYLLPGRYVPFAVEFSNQLILTGMDCQQ